MRSARDSNIRSLCDTETLGYVKRIEETIHRLYAIVNVASLFIWVIGHSLTVFDPDPIIIFGIN